MNWIDILILIILGYYAFRGFHQGIISIIIELAGYIVAYYVSLKYYFIGLYFVDRYIPKYLPAVYHDTIGISATFLMVMIVYYVGAFFIIRLIPPFISHSLVNKIIGVIGSLLKGLVIISMILFVINLIPLPQSYRKDLNKSIIANKIIEATTTISKNLGSNISTKISDTLKEISIIPNSKESNQTTNKDIIYLGYQINNTSINQNDEKIMFDFVNNQRLHIGLNKLSQNDKLTLIAREYGKFMFANGFFSHITPSGQSPLDRVRNTDIQFTYVGENIAKAPDVDSANTGFMKSPEHRANILEPNYTYMGIGVVDGGPYGKMFVQEFIGTH